MLTLITHAKPPPQVQVLPALPNLTALLRLLSPSARHTTQEDALSPLDEQLQAQALGLEVQDGLLPWAALQAHDLQLPFGGDGQGWAWLTPCHWQVNADHVRMATPSDSQISEDESRQVMEAMRAYFAEDGIVLHGLHQGNWLAQGALFHQLATASLAQASGRAVDHWLPRQAQAQALRRLQNEMQMLLYSHSVNEARTARGLLPISTFWVSGTGSLPANYLRTNGAKVEIALREPARHGNAATWSAAWQALDAGAILELLHLAQGGTPLTLTLCGQNAAQSFSLQPQGLWQRISKRFSDTDIPALLQGL